MTHFSRHMYAGIRTTLLLETVSSQRDLGLADRGVTGGEQKTFHKEFFLTKKDHILNQEFTTLPSGRRRLRCPICKKRDLRTLLCQSQYAF